MPSHLKQTLLLLCLIKPIDAEVPHSIPTASYDKSYTVVYTGRLFGYFRYPAVQATSDTTCPSLDDEGGLSVDPAKEALAFAAQMKAAATLATGTVVRVAVGDNFAPYLLSRGFLVDTDTSLPTANASSPPAQQNLNLNPQDSGKQWKALPPFGSKADYEYDFGYYKKWVSSPQLDITRDRVGYERYLNGQGTLPTDNVACFLMAMRFDAIVPGMHDFYFGPERPRELARLMWHPSAGYSRVRMLGANLYLATRYLDPTKPGSPDSPTAESASEDASSKKGGQRRAKQPDQPVEGQPKAVIPKTPLPWMRAVHIRGALKVDWANNCHQSAEAEAALARTDFCNKAILQFKQFLCPNGNESQQISGVDRLTKGENTFVLTKRVKTIQLSCVDPKPPANRYLTGCPDVIKSRQIQPLTDGEVKSSGNAISLEPDPDSPIQTDLEYWIPKDHELLQANTQYQLIVNGVPSSPKPFVVQFPYFEYPYSPKPLDESMLPWVFKKGQVDPKSKQLGQSVAIFGLVDPDLDRYIGKLNSTWLDVTSTTKRGKVDDRHETDLKVADAAESLLQALQFCYQDAQCRSAKKVLLAEMPAEKVYTLLGEFHATAPIDPLDVIIAQADPDRPTSEGVLVRTRDNTNRRTQVPSTPILVPGSHFLSDDPYQLQVRLQAATITNCRSGGPAGCSSTPTQSVENRIYSSDPLEALDPFKAVKDIYQRKYRVHPALISPSTGIKVSETIRADRFAKLGINIKDLDSPAQWKSAMEKVAVLVMQEACHSDVAMLQHRDVFIAPQIVPHLKEKIDPSLARILIDAMFWKGDAIECLNVPAQRINSVLRASKQLQHQQESGLVTDLTSNWDLVTVGADYDADDTHRVINGEFVDPKRLFDVAATDFLADGGTGYAAFQGAQPLPNSKWSKLQLRDLMRFVSREVIENRIDPKDTYRAAEYLDELQRPGPSAKPDSTFTGWFKGLFEDFDRFESLKPSTKPFEMYAQEIPRWSLMLYKADLSYAVTAHNGSEASVAQRFPGVGFVDLSSANSTSEAFDYSVRVQHDTKNWEFYGQSDFNYSYKKVRGKNNLYTRSEPADYWNQETGFAFRLDPRHQSSSAWKLLIPGAFRNQVPPLVQIAPINAAASSASKSTTFVRQEATWYPSFRPGIRWDYAYPKPSDSATQAQSGASGDTGATKAGGETPSSGILASYLEFGYQIGSLMHSPQAYQFSNGTTCYVADLVPCLTALGSTTQGSSSTLSTIVAGRTHFQNGLYLNFRFDVPILNKLEYVNENRGDFFFGAHNDASVDTRFFDDWRQSLKIPINRKLSIAPTLQLIVFQNKVLENYYRSFSTFVSLDYTLDWHWMLKFQRAVEYQNPVPTQPTLPSR